MNYQLTTLIATISLFLISVSTYAQDRRVGTPEERATRQTIRMKEVLNLSPSQESDIAAINLKYAKHIQPLLETGSRNLKTLREARSIMKRKDKEMKTVLTKVQYQQYQEIRKEMRSTLREGWKQRS